VIESEVQALYWAGVAGVIGEEDLAGALALGVEVDGATCVFRKVSESDIAGFRKGEGGRSALASRGCRDSVGLI